MYVSLLIATGVAIGAIAALTFINSLIQPSSGVDVASCSEFATFAFVETVPKDFGESMEFYPRTHEMWIQLLRSANSSIQIVTPYIDLTGGVSQGTGTEGLEVFNAIRAAALRSVQIEIVQNLPTVTHPNTDSILLQEEFPHIVHVMSVDYASVMTSGTIGTKLLIVDGREYITAWCMIVDFSESFYLGSAPMTWRALAIEKQLGVVVHNCEKLALNAQKIFSTYVMMRDWAVVPPADAWPYGLKTQVTLSTPARVTLNGTVVSTFIAESPPQLCAPLRTSTLSAVQSAINMSTTTIRIAVSQYLPGYEYASSNHYWPVIDDYLRTAAYANDIRVQLLISHQNITAYPNELAFLKSLSLVPGIEVKLFQIPASGNTTLVSNSRYMVTDNVAYIGSSDWTADWFLVRGGAAMWLSDAPESIAQLQTIFDRDWYSQYAQPLKTCE